MLKAFKQLDEILRGDATQLSSLENGQIELPLKGLLLVMILLGVIAGICIGSFNLLHPLDENAVITTRDAWMQTFASAVKLPLLFFLTLLITFPSLYVFNALVGSRLKLMSVLKLLVASIAVMLSVVASLGPIVVFFSLCTTSYSFMKLLNVAVSGIAGLLGLAFLLRTLHRLVVIQENKLIAEAAAASPPPPPLTTAAPESPDVIQAKRLSALDRYGQTHGKARSVVRIWTLVFGLVGAQMSWVLRPFIGSPYLPFEWFRDRQSNFFMAVIQALQHLLSID
jgi:ABC-type multidrug transport system fused ATPase/permease subunit